MAKDETVVRYKRAVKFLDGCGALTLDKLREAQRIAGAGLPEEELRSKWESAKFMLPMDGEPGGHEQLRFLFRESLVQGIATFEALGPAPWEKGSRGRRKWWEFWK